jgi:ABC-type polysaccharide/polyol phosphate export permease
MIVFAYDCPSLGVFWSMLAFFVRIAWIVILFRAIFRHLPQP